MVDDAKLALENGAKMQLSTMWKILGVIGTRLSSHIVRQFGMTGLREDIYRCVRSSAGQSLGYL